MTARMGSSSKHHSSKPRAVRKEARGDPRGPCRGLFGLIGADEEGTLAALKTIRRQVFDPKIAEHRGPEGALSCVDVKVVLPTNRVVTLSF
jgi:hypothetical protein